MMQRQSDAISVYSYRRGCQSGYAVPDVSHGCLEKLIAFPEWLFRLESHQTIKRDEHTLLVRSMMPTREGRVTVACKRVRRTSLRKWLSGLLRGNRAFQSWSLAGSFAEMGLGTARPVAAVVPDRYLPWRDTFLFTEWLDEALQVDHFVASLRELSSADQFRLESQAAASLGRLLGRMHAAGISHRDLKVANLMLRASSDGVDAYVIDLDGAARCPWLTPWRRYKDLARLAICFPDHAVVRRTTMWRFLKAYVQTVSSGGTTTRAAWVALARASLRLRRHKRQPLPAPAAGTEAA